MPRAKKPMVLMGLIKEKAAQQFLVDLANLRPLDPLGEGWKLEKEFLRRWGWMFPEFDLSKDEDRHALSSFVLLHLNVRLQEMWKGGRLREREWLLHDIRQYYNGRRVERTAEFQHLQQRRDEARAQNN